MHNITAPSCIVDLLIKEYLDRFNYYNEDFLDAVIDDVYKKTVDISMDEKIEIWKKVSQSLKNKL